MGINKSWQGLMQAVDVNVKDETGKVLWHADRLYNLFHNDGENFMLQATFVGGKISSVIPENYYLGLDNRLTILEGDTLSDLVQEPTLNGYARQAIGSSNEFSVSRDPVSGHYMATSPIVTFSATGGTWGPVSNLFLTTSAVNSGYLLSSAALETSISLAASQAVTLRLVLMLKDCSL